MEAKSMVRRMERSSLHDVIRASSPLNNGEYHIRYCTNTSHKTSYISWLGTQKEIDNAFGQSLKRKVRVVPIISPPPIWSTSTVSELVMLNDGVTVAAEQPYVVSDQYNTTKLEYEQALNRAIAIFDAQPDTPEFEELNSLLPLVKDYEDMKLNLPELAVLDVIRLTIGNFDLLRQLLIPIIGNEEEVDLFLTGKLQLSKATLELICNTIGIRY